MDTEFEMSLLDRHTNGYLTKKKAKALFNGKTHDECFAVMAEYEISWIPKNVPGLKLYDVLSLYR